MRITYDGFTFDEEGGSPFEGEVEVFDFHNCSSKGGSNTTAGGWR